jgi:glutamate:GABA antiporter
VFELVIVSLLGMAVPLNLGAEIIQRKGASKYLLWGTVVTVVVYLFATLAVVAIVPPADLSNPAFLTEAFSLAFGSTIGTALGILNYAILVLYFICAVAAFNTMFARLLLVAGIDRRLPTLMRRLNTNRVPFNATLAQTLFNIVLIALIFVIAPLFAPSSQGLSTLVFLITINGASVVWNIAMIGLFLSGIILFARYARQLAGKWIIPPFLLYLACLAGIGAAGVAIYFTFFAGSPLPALLNNQNWFYWVLLVTLASLAIGATYSYLVPEAEDIAALLRSTPPTKRKTPTQGLAESTSPGGDYHHAHTPSAQFVRNTTGEVPFAPNPRVPGELFPNTIGNAGTRGPGNLY